MDVILATGDPFPIFKLAARLSKKLGRPYVLDYRDPWTGNPHKTRPPKPAAIQEEARLLAGCTAVTIVSPSWGAAMDARFGLGPKLHMVTNGYDPDELAEIEPYHFGHFAIVYTGSLYPPKRVISPVMAALKKFEATARGKAGEWYFHYYGPNNKHVREQAKRFSLVERVVLHGRVSRTEALSAVRGAGVAAVITSVDEQGTLADNGILTAKVFEALGLRTPVLLIAPSGSDVHDVAERAGLARVFTSGKTDDIASFLEELMGDRIPPPREPDVYAWPNIIKNLDSILQRAMKTQ